MSRVAGNPVTVPTGVDVVITGQQINVKGPKGALEFTVHDDVQICQDEDKALTFKMSDSSARTAMAGTSRSLVNNMVVGVSEGFEKKLLLKGVGYRAILKGKKLELTLGFSHPVVHDLPEGITVDIPSATEVTVKGISKQLVGQVAAEIRSYRPPEPYKGKGVRYIDEVVVIKETKKK